MVHERYPHLFARCWPIFWPWLWWQLIQLEAWVELEQRDLMIGVSRWGRVYILMRGDGPRATDCVPPLAWRLAAFDPMAAIPDAACDGCSSLRAALCGVASSGVVCTVPPLAGAGAALRLVAYPGCPPGTALPCPCQSEVNAADPALMQAPAAAAGRSWGGAYSAASGAISPLE